MTQILISDKYANLPDSTPTSGVWGVRLPTVVLGKGSFCTSPHPSHLTMIGDTLGCHSPGGSAGGVGVRGEQVEARVAAKGHSVAQESHHHKELCLEC